MPYPDDNNHTACGEIESCHQRRQRRDANGWNFVSKREAFDVDLHCPVTLKVINERYLGDESARLRFLREARAAASVRQMNVASVLQLGRTGNSYFYAMEFVEGEHLRT
jgi:serine/threonine protein kinase